MLLRKNNRFPNTIHEEPSLDISSLIDVCFLLLIYFLVTTTIQPREADIQMTFPDSFGASERFPLSPLLISIKEDHSIILNETTAAETLDREKDQHHLPLLEERLQVFIHSTTGHPNSPFIQINAHDNANQQRVIDVLNLLAKLKIENVTFTDLGS